MKKKVLVSVFVLTLGGMLLFASKDTPLEYLAFSVVLFISFLLALRENNIMNINLALHGAYRLPRGYRYQLNLVEVHGDLAEVSISIVKKISRRFLWFRIPGKKRMGVSRIIVGRPITEKNPMGDIVLAANRLARELGLVDETR